MVQLVLVVSLIFGAITTYFIASGPAWRVVELPRRVVYIGATFLLLWLVMGMLLGIFVLRVAQ